MQVHHISIETSPFLWIRLDCSKMCVHVHACKCLCDLKMWKGLMIKLNLVSVSDYRSHCFISFKVHTTWTSFLRILIVSRRSLWHLGEYSSGVSQVKNTFIHGLFSFMCLLSLDICWEPKRMNKRIAKQILFNSKMILI